MTTFASLQATLARIQDIRNRFEPPAGPAVPENGFEDALQQAQRTRAQRSDILDLIRQESANQSMDPNLIEAVVQAESGFNPGAVSPAGALGLMQLMPGTADDLGVSNPLDPQQNVRGGVKYLKQMIGRFNSLPLGLAAYNAGPGAVEKHHGIPPYAETKAYVSKIIRQYEASKAMGGLTE